MANETFLTDCGLPGIRKIPYGLHACHFYPDRAHLIEALVPFFLAGLYNSERCLWITAPPLPATEAQAALEEAWSGTGEAIARGALRIIDFDVWYGTGTIDASKVVNAWLEEEARALGESYRGLRVAGNTSFLREQEWNDFMDYERKAGETFAGRRIVALCSYLLGNCSAQQAVDVIRAHDCAFDQRDAAWQIMSGQIP